MTHKKDVEAMRRIVQDCERQLKDITLDYERCQSDLWVKGSPDVALVRRSWAYQWASNTGNAMEIGVLADLEKCHSNTQDKTDDATRCRTTLGGWEREKEMEEMKEKNDELKKQLENQSNQPTLPQTPS
ncbi:hypothetical protein K402DRAFT_409064 [Aulographum hederae CBS 113979]|uniref:Uncharacterized protein n=1 Tax=Aulographum hederae CBS 113979 TaxID=1176131 RepID=A0A6G1GIH1_9PEZI|nr:hypothetical protein K402DRAFT_409064 [Aulographum hederae CBS 113979]